MATIAKSSITLVSISDAYSVSLQPSNITINADPYGNNPKLENAFTIISLYCGDIQVPISSASIVGSSLWEEGSNIHKQDYSLEIVGNSVKLSITSIGNQLSGWREIEVITNAGQKLTARFSYTVVRETTMLDWILEWDKNLTEISGDHVATPNAFIGNKDGDGKLTGVYIGGGENHPYLPGIYGFKGCTPEAFAQGNLGSTEIFHLNENGGMIGGWDISNTGLIKENSVGRLEILSEGTIRYVNLLDATNPFWELKSDGSGSFASGHITWDVGGNATFDGKLKAQSGEIGGWAIGSHSLYNTSILLDSANSFFGLRGPSGLMFINEPLSSSFYDSITRAGGIAIYYTDSTHYGLEGWLQGSPTTIDYNKGTQIFGLGSKNFIASWNIGVNALWRGDLVNTAGNFTGKSGDITIGSQGIRGYRWYIDADGEADFMQGRVHLGPSKCEIAGWTIQENRLCTSKAALVNDTNYAGLFLSTNVLGSSEGVALTDKIASSGGIYLITTSNHAELAAYSVGDILLFKLTSSGTNQIASWKFDHKRIYIGASDLIPGSKFTAFSNSLVLSDNGIHAPKWCLLADGSGKLASGNISWDETGKANFTGKIIANSGSIGGFEIGDGHIGVTATASGESRSADWANLSIYKDFFKVGGSKGYVMFGDDVIPSSMGGAFTTVGRIVNNAPNILGSYGFDQANYGILINVSGGTKNYGISSNAALKAPAFVNTAVKILTFTGNGYTIDFSQHNVFLLYYTSSQYSKVEVTLPSEASVASQFGVNTLPENFGTVLTFKVRTGSKNIVLKGIYNHNEDFVNYELASGDSIQVLVSKVDGFRYQILNHSA